MKKDAFSLKDIVEGIDSFPNVAVADTVDFTDIFDETKGIFYDYHYLLVAPKVPVYSTGGLNRILLELENGLGPDYVEPCRIRDRVLVYGKLYFTMQPDKEVEHYQYGVITLIPNAGLGPGIRKRVSEGRYIALGRLDMKLVRRMKLADMALRRH